MRGKVRSLRPFMALMGITPAYAGKSFSVLSVSPVCQDHPRLCGEKNEMGVRPDQGAGSPPPMRGKAKKQIKNMKLA